MKKHGDDLEKLQMTGGAEGSLSQPGLEQNVIGDLEARLDALRKRCETERFVWVMVTLVLLNFAFLRGMEWGGALVTGCFEVLFVLCLAHHRGFEYALSVWNAVLNTFDRKDRT
jgi:hypothetical protein